MTYLNVNIILSIILLLIFVPMFFLGHLTLLFLAIYKEFRVFFFMGLLPTSFAVVNLITTIYLGQYDYIKHCFIPLIFPLILVFFKSMKRLKYHRIHKKYDDTIDKYILDFLEKKNVDMTNIHIGKWYKEPHGEIQCNVYLRILDKSFNLNRLRVEVEEYISTCIPELYFHVSAHDKII